MRKDPFFPRSESFLEVNVSPFDDDEDLIAGMTTRRNGNSRHSFHSLNMAYYTGDDPAAVSANRQAIADQIGPGFSHWVEAEQVHGDHIIEMSSTNILNETPLEADGMYTRERGILLTSYYADCVPLFFYSPLTRYVGLAHAGWKGTSLDIGGKLVKEWIYKKEVPVGDIVAVIGPSISQARYEVDERVIHRMDMICPKEKPKPWYTSKKGHYQLNLKQMNALLLEKAGLPLENIFISKHCTYIEDNLFFSHRRDQGTTGRMMTCIGIKNDGTKESTGGKHGDNCRKFSRHSRNN
ncbi:peptidoglycan editing factor PgeF [Alteribacillus iranensis]|uniref:Purine nucleoside phosphorylase n=1 Tax=Alteribacillus iranensis TaxID=930128 RepID=A0A1I2ACY6_9BACI|nr:peptidoglycan editing factor PgeF [Alteribacillus iranensis]SFE40700.1 conserved hypothetical protein [Alteribacillus iranensis]